MIRNLFLMGMVLWCCIGCTTYRTFYGPVRTDVTDSTARRIDFSYQDITEVPDLDAMEDLRMLDLSGNTRLDISKTLNTLSHPDRLEVLRLDSLNLRHLPDLSRFQNLKQLSLIHNPDLNWDMVFTALSSLPLEFLNLKGNAISTLPKSVTQLESIKDLNLSYNKLTDEESYTYLAALPLLYNLWLDHNELNVLPDAIGLLDQVVYFYIDHNNLTILPDALSGMKGLRVMHAGDNAFKELPEVLIEAESLFLAHLNNNKISHIPERYFTDKFNLMALILDNNPVPQPLVKRAQKRFSNFFLLSFQQKNYGYH